VLVLAALVSVPISAAAYGFLALVDGLQEALLPLNVILRPRRAGPPPARSSQVRSDAGV
jgi:hypothetical protein